MISARTPRWAVLAAYAVPLCLLPSAIWRWYIAATMPDGWYPAMLSFLQMGTGLLTLGLVHSWGEVVPRWVPWLGGRRIPVAAAVVPAALGAIMVALLCLYAMLNGIFHWVSPEEARALSPGGAAMPTDDEQPGFWVGVAYAPVLAWAPLLAAVTVAYYYRRRGEATSSSATG